MREIRFRGKSIITGKWVHGLYAEGGFVNPETSEITKRYLIDSDILYDVDPDTIGLKADSTDSVGNPIHEGDILHIGDNRIRYVVEWVDNGLKAKQIGSSSYIGLAAWQNCLTLMGNKYDNPELLKT